MAVTETYLECLEALVQATEQVKTAAAASDWDQLLARLAERQEIMNRIDAMPGTALAISEADRARAMSLLDHVAHEDGLLANSLTEAIASTRAALGESSRTQQSISAYRKVARTQPNGTAARFVDTQR